MTIEALPQLVPQVCRIAAQAGQEIVAVRQAGYEVFEKPDRSPVTTADLEAHRKIAAGLKELDLPWPVLSEEAVEPVPWERRRDWETYWLVDPLDGTREFLRESPEFTVNIALVHRHQPVLGVIGAPALGLLYYAHRGGGARRQDAQGMAEAIRCRAFPKTELPVVAASRRHAGPHVKPLLERLEPYQERRIGSSLKSCRIAEGSVDLYPRHGPTHEWDTAAAQCIVEEAGGSILDWQLQPLRYNRGSSLINPSFLVLGDRRHDWAALLDGLPNAPA